MGDRKSQSNSIQSQSNPNQIPIQSQSNLNTIPRDLHPCLLDTPWKPHGNCRVWKRTAQTQNNQIAWKWFHFIVVSTSTFCDTKQNKSIRITIISPWNVRHRNINFPNGYHPHPALISMFLFSRFSEKFYLIGWRLHIFFHAFFLVRSACKYHRHSRPLLS